MAARNPSDNKQLAIDVLTDALCRCRGAEPVWSESNLLLEALLHASMLLPNDEQRQLRDWLLDAVTELRDTWLDEPSAASAESSP